MNALEHILCFEYQEIKQRPQHAKNHPQNQIQPQRVHRRIGELTHLNDCGFAVENTKHNARHDHASEDRLDRDKVVAKLRAHLFDDKQYPGQRRVEGRRKPRRGPGRQQRMACFAAAHAENIRHHPPDISAELHRWPFTA
ncbi:hypothetical protein D3C72_1315320 [compost metagenome]